MKALRKEPERRYSSAEQLSDDLQRFLDRRPVLASSDSIGYRARKFVSRHRVAMIAAAAVALAVLAGIAATVWQARVARRERTRAERQFNAVRGLAGSVLGEVHDAVQRLPGSTAAREIMLRRGTEYLDALAREAQDDVTLRREVAAGYLRLGTVQGTSGLPNLGDRAATRASYLKAIALLEPIAGPDRGDVTDRLNLALGLVRVAQTEQDSQVRDASVRRAHAIIDALTPAERATPFALSVRQVLWGFEAQARIAARDYAAARQAHEQVRDVAEAAFGLTPADLDASRNLSLAYKQLGAVLEVLQDRAQAMALYEKAIELDRRRVAAEPSRPMWRLDLSFAHGAMGAALMAQGDLDGALARYREAVALREAVVAEDPREDFAKLALARGYERLSIIHGRLGDATTAVGYSVRRVRVYQERMAAHPERDNVWNDYTAAAFDAVQTGRELVDSVKTPPAIRRALLPTLVAILDGLAAAEQQWARDKRPGAFPVAASDLQHERERLAAGARAR